MKKKDDSGSIDPRKAYGWKVSDEELENNFLLVCEASYMAYEFARNSTSPKLLSLAEETLQSLQQQGMAPFPLPQKGFSIAQVGLILAAENWFEKARKQLLVVTQPDVIWRGIDDVSKTDLERFYKRLTQTIAKFRGGKESFLYHSSGGNAPGAGKQRGKIVENPPLTGEGVLSPVFDSNLRLAYEASVWADFVATNAGVLHKIIYEENLRVAKGHLKRLKDESKDPGPFPKRGYTLAQGKMLLDFENYAKSAYEAFHRAFDDASFPTDDGISRKKSLHKFYREFNPKKGKGPQPNIKSFLRKDFFHRKNPTELLMESQDFWETPEGKVRKNQRRSKRLRET